MMGDWERLHQAIRRLIVAMQIEVLHILGIRKKGPRMKRKLCLGMTRQAGKEGGMSFTNQKQRVVTKEDLIAPWSGYKNGSHFYCRLCGSKFKVGDKWRWVFAGSIKRVNLMVCEACDNGDVLEKWDKWWKEWEHLAETRFRYIAVMLEDARKG